MGRYILDFYLGRVSLKKTIIFSMIIVFFLTLAIFIMLDYLPFALLFLYDHSYLIYIFLGFMAFLTIFLVLCIYRSSSMIRGEMKYIAIISIFTIVSLSASSSSNILSAIYNKNNIFESAVLSLNNQLPTMIDKDTKLERVYIEDGNIFYEYTLINISAKSVNQDFITLAMSDKVYQYANLDRVILKLSNKKREIHYVFKDKDKVVISSIKLF